MDVDALAAEIDDRVRALPAPSTGAIRRVRRDYSRRLRPVPAEQVLALALALAARAGPGRDHLGLGGVGGPVVAAGRPGLDRPPQPPLPGRDRRHRAQAPGGRVGRG
jgi:hypothetical protein